MAGIMRPKRGCDMLVLLTLLQRGTVPHRCSYIMYKPSLCHDASVMT